MARFHKLKVKEIKRETADAVSVAFEVPAPQQPEYLFKQGQYITLKLNLKGEEVRRSYSLCTAPHEKELRVAVKEVKNGLVSGYINQELKVGDSIDVMTPMGNFHTVLSGNQKKNYVLFAGGSGITPMMSILKSILYVEKQSNITLIYANKNESSTIFKTELDEIASSHPQLKLVYIFEEPITESADLHKGLLTIEKTTQLIESHGGLNADEFFICGPGPMMENVKGSLEKLNIAQEKIHIEYFSSVIDAVNKAEGQAGPDVKAQVTVIQYGIETNFELETSGISVLDASIEAGVDAPFSCKGAVCCTCRAKVIEGSARMDANFALTDDEVADGFILTCQAHPTSEKLIVDFDAI